VTIAPSGEQLTITGGGYTAVVTESGGALRALEHAGRQLVDGFPVDAMSSGGRGQLLMPWPNRIRDGRYEFGGKAYQLGLTEPSRHNASHGLARWAAWSVAERSEAAVTLRYRVMAQTGYPWALDLAVSYAVGEDGLTVTQSATNLAPSPAPYASGAHPYLSAGAGPIDAWTLHLPAATRVLSDDERLLPVGREDVGGTAYDYRVARPVGDTVFNHAYGDLERDADGRATVGVTGPEGTTELWVDERHPWLMVYSGDDTGSPRVSLAVEPMTAPVDAFNSGEDLVTLEPGATHAVTWGIRSA
jgi:aldose 1-epimerase